MRKTSARLAITASIVVGMSLAACSTSSSSSGYAGPDEVVDAILESSAQCFPDDPEKEPAIEEIENGWILDCEGWDVRLADGELPPPSDERCEEDKQGTDERIDKLTVVNGDNWYATALPNLGEWPAHAPSTTVADGLGGEVLTFREFTLQDC